MLSLNASQSLNFLHKHAIRWQQQRSSTCRSFFQKVPIFVNYRPPKQV